MMISGAVALIIGLLFQLLIEVNSECNNTLMQFFTSYSLGKQDELNKTFTKIQEKTPMLNNVTYKQNQFTTYTLSNIKPVFNYLDSNQSSQVAEGTNVIVVSGGKVEVQYQFQWQKSNSSLSGSGVAKSLSDQLGFVKLIKIETKFALQQLVDWQNVTFYKHKTNITRISPASISQADFNIIDNMFNSLQNVKTVKQQIIQDIDKSYSYYLNLSLYDDKRVIDEFYEYKWAGLGSSISIQYQVLMNKITLQNQGLTGLYLQTIVNDTDWSCSHDVPSLHLNPKVFGSQQYITMDIFKNTLRYAVQRGVLNTELNRNWQSRFFQFYAGDLYEVIPKLAETNYATDAVIGNCKTVPQNLNIIKGSHDSINVTMTCNCELGIARQKIAAFSVNLTSEVQIIPNQKQLNLLVKAFSFVSSFTDDQKYVIANKQLANTMVTHSLNRLIGSKNIFGSGWPLYTRDHPHVIVQDDYIIIYDSTYVGSTQQIKFE